MLIRLVLALSALFVSVAAWAQQQPDPLNRAIVEGQSQPPSPSREASESRPAQLAAPDQRGTDQLPLAVKIQPAADAEKKAAAEAHEREEKSAIDKMLAFETQRIADYTKGLGEFTLGLVIVAIFQAGLFVWQLFYMREGVRDARKAAEAAKATAEYIPRVERAYLTGGGPVVVGPDGRFFRVEVANYGKTPAFVSAFDVHFATLAQVQAGPRPVNPSRPYDDRLPADNSTKAIDFIAIPPGTEVIYGAFWYQDWMKREHIFRFILRIGEDGDTRTDVTGVDASYSYWD